MIEHPLPAYASIRTAPMPGFNLRVSLLTPSRAIAIRRAVEEGWLDGLFCAGELWVNRNEVHDLVPPGHDTYDESDQCCFIGEHLVAHDPRNPICTSNR